MLLKTKAIVLKTLKYSENKYIIDLLTEAEGRVSVVINIPKNYTETELDNGYQIRRAAIDFNIPLFTNTRLATAFIRAFCSTKLEDIRIKSWEEY